MPKENKKNVIQDVIPPKRSIRDVELPHKNKRIMEEPKIPVYNKTPVKPTEEDLIVPKTAVPPIDITPPYKYEYESKKPSRKIFHVTLTVFALVLVFAFSSLFKSAKITIIPKQEVKAFNDVFTAKKDSNKNELGFQIVTISKEVEKTVNATTEQKVERKAQGKIIIYNNYNIEPQKLVATTRFQTTEGLIFRLVKPVTVPGTQIKDSKTVAGSIEVLVEADQVGPSYNIGLKDFTIPGFKGDPKYKVIYARSKTEMSGGFSGQQKIVSKDVLDGTDNELTVVLKDSLAKDITSQIPANFMLYKSSLSYNLDSTSVSNIPASGNTLTNKAVLKKKGIASAIMFDKGSLSRSIISKALPTLSDDMVKVTNLETLDFSLATGTTFDPNSSSLLTFNLKGQANFVWTIDENKLKTDLLGLSKNNAKTVISTYPAVKEAWVEVRPFWNQTIPNNPLKVSLVNTLTK